MSEPWYRRSADEAVAEYDTSVEEGLSSTDASDRLEKYGPNRIELTEPPSWFSFFWDHLTEFVSLLLIVVAGISLATYVLSPGAPIERLATGVIIVAIVLINATIGAYQEYRSVNTAQKLREMMQTRATVRRDGARSEIDSEDVVPGDVVLLNAGDKVPADVRLVETDDLQVQEAVLTGESTTVEKSAATIDEERPLAERGDMAFANTHVTRGEGVGVVVATGKDTEVGSIAERTESIQEAAPFVDEVQDTAMRIAELAIVLVVVASAVFFFYGRDLFSIFLLAAALIVGAIPAALPVTVTYALTNAMRKMADRNALVKNLALLETVGGVDVICTDKTGTLTQNRMTVRRFLLPATNPRQASTTVLEGDEYEDGADDDLLRCAILANEAEATRQADGAAEAGDEPPDEEVAGADGENADERTYLGDPEDVGLLEYAESLGVDVASIRDQAEQVDFLPFSSEYKQVQALVERDGQLVRYAKGAPEVILERCDRVRVDGEIEAFSDEWKAQVSDRLDDFSADALRNLAFSQKSVDGDEGVGADTDGDVFLGAVGMWDPPREGVAAAIETMYGAGIDVKMITGDSEATAVAIAEECGFADVSAVAWEDVKDADDDELEEFVEEHNVFARMDPSLKMSMVEALHRRGHRVAITGDGVNDVPPIEAAEVGVAMGERGSDITRDAADIILLDDAFPTIQSAIEYGRTVLSNVRKTVNYLMTANLFEVVVVFLSALMGFTPFRALQLLWVNFATDIFPAMALGSDPPHDDIMDKKPTGAEETILTRRIWYFLVSISSVKVVMAFITFFATLAISAGATTIMGVTGDLAMAQTTVFVWLGFSHILRIVTIRWDEGWRWSKVFVNRWVNYSLLWPIAAFLVILYTPLAHFFGAEPLPLWAWGVVVSTNAVGAVAVILVALGIDRRLGGYGETEY
ncbi:MAG: cation-translocating P-type ATPase [Haloarculaceae archaeon]